MKKSIFEKEIRIFNYEFYINLYVMKGKLYKYYKVYLEVAKAYCKDIYCIEWYKIFKLFKIKDKEF